jgi:hypothetical protein
MGDAEIAVAVLADRGAIVSTAIGGPSPTFFFSEKERLPD